MSRFASKAAPTRLKYAAAHQRDVWIVNGDKFSGRTAIVFIVLDCTASQKYEKDFALRELAIFSPEYRSNRCGRSVLAAPCTVLTRGRSVGQRRGQQNRSSRKFSSASRSTSSSAVITLDFSKFCVASTIRRARRNFSQGPLADSLSEPPRAPPLLRVVKSFQGKCEHRRDGSKCHHSLPKS